MFVLLLLVVLVLGACGCGVYAAATTTYHHLNVLFSALAVLGLCGGFCCLLVLGATQ